MKPDYTEAEYPFLVKELMLYINKMKTLELESDVSLVDIIMEFCFRNELDVELVGDAIASDVYFKSFIEKDCEMHNVILRKLPELNKTW